MKHTPGKWEAYSYYDEGVFERHGVRSNGDEYICEEATEGDANLIASAPEMLNALKMILDYHDRDKDNETDLHFENARDVIANAGGE